MRLTEQHLKAAEVLARGGTYEDAAREAGVHRRSIAKWLHNAEFRAEINRILDDIRARAGRRAWAVIQGALDNGDVRTARWLLQRTDLARDMDRGATEIHLHLGYGARPPEIATNPEADADDEAA